MDQFIGDKDFYLSADGRVCRKDYWLKYIVPYLVSYIVLFALTAATGIPIIILLLAWIWPGIVITIKRLHDRNMTAWFILLALVPIANLFILVVTWFLPGTQGSNDYGPDPLGGSAAVV